MAINLYRVHGDVLEPTIDGARKGFVYIGPFFLATTTAEVMPQEALTPINEADIGLRQAALDVAEAEWMTSLDLLDEDRAQVLASLQRVRADEFIREELNTRLDAEAPQRVFTALLAAQTFGLLSPADSAAFKALVTWTMTMRDRARQLTLSKAMTFRDDDEWPPVPVIVRLLVADFTI